MCENIYVYIEIHVTVCANVYDTYKYKYKNICVYICLYICIYKRVSWYPTKTYISLPPTK